jgi:hypothetical protein
MGLMRVRLSVKAMGGTVVLNFTQIRSILGVTKLFRESPRPTWGAEPTRQSSRQGEAMPYARTRRARRWLLTLINAVHD